MNDFFLVSTEDGHSFNLSFTRSSLKTSSRTPIILCLPAMGTASKYYAPLIESLNDCGYISLCGELRGTGSSTASPMNADFSYKEIIDYDIPTSITKIRKIYPSNPLYLLGHSLGGQLSLLYSSVDDSELSGVIVVASGSVFYKSYGFPNNIAVLIGTQVANLISKIVGYFPGNKLGFGGVQPKGIIKDWAYQSRTGNYKLQSSCVNFESRLRTLDIPILAISIEQDNLAPEGAVEHLCEKMESAAIERKHFSIKLGDPKRNPHFYWVKDNKGVVNQASSWIDKQSDHDANLSIGNKPSAQ